MNRWMSLDVGSKTIGVAITDPLKITVRPLTTLARTTISRDAQSICELMETQEVDKLIVGMPKHLDGRRSATLDFIEPLVEHLDTVSMIPIEWAEERLSTKRAEELMAETGLSLAERRKKRNEYSAAVILQWYLEESR
ncbi:MAG: Holliday junction resolvase RuvX [Acidobacteriota bacterium]